MYSITETLEYIIKAIIKDSEGITINSYDQEGMLILEVSAPKEVTGQIIGKEGRIIKSIRTILNLSFPNQKFILKIKD